MDYTQPYDSGLSSGHDPVFTGAIFIFIAVVSIVTYIIYAVLLSLLFKKAGEKAWKAWVPVYNQWVFLELGGQKGWLSLLSLAAVFVVPFVVLYVYLAIAANRIAIAFGKDSTFVLLYLFLPLVWMIWLAFDKTAVWHGTPSVGTDASSPPTA